MPKFKIYDTQTLGEEIANAISHGLGSLLSVAAMVVLIVKAAFTMSITIAATESKEPTPCEIALAISSPRD